MSAYIKRYRARNGATVIQVVYKDGRKVTKTVHIGTGHTEADIDLLTALAKEEIRGKQLELGLSLSPEDSVGLMALNSYSELLYNTLGTIYDSLGFSSLEDEVFKELVVARIIELTSKLDTVRVLSELGLDAPSNAAIHRCLSRTVTDDYRSRLSHLS